MLTLPLTPEQLKTAVPFDYDLIEKGYEVVTRDGKEQPIEVVRLKSKLEQPIFSVFNSLIKYFYCSNGFYAFGGRTQSSSDLVMIPPVTVKYMVIYPKINKLFTYNRLDIIETEHPHKGNFFIEKVSFLGDEVISVELVQS